MAELANKVTITIIEEDCYDQGKKIVFTSLLIFALLANLVVASAATTSVKVKVDGNLLPVSTAPVASGSEYLVPAKDVFEALGAKVSVSNSGMSIWTADKSIYLSNNSADAYVGTDKVKMPAATQLVKKTLMVPVSFIKTTLGASVLVTGNNTLKTISITYFSKMTGTLKIGGSTTIQPIAQSAADMLIDMNSGLSVTVAGGGSGAGIKGAMDGTFNVGMSSAELTSSDLKTYPGIKEYKIGKDGIVVITNPSNPVKNLTKQQVIDIFTGKITNWKDVGGSNAAIFIQTRESTSGTLKAFGELALNKENIAGTATPQASNGLMMQAVAANKNAIGFLSLGYLDSTVKAVSIENIAPTKANAINGKWPYIRPLIVVTNGTPAPLAAKFMNYLTSPDGQDMLADEGYLPLNVKD